MKGNKGEWSEYYTFLKLLDEGRLDFGGAHYSKLEEGFYKVLKIVRNERDDVKTYEPISDGKIKMLSVGQEKIIDTSELKEKIKDIFSVLSGDTETTFTIEGTDELIGKLESHSLNAGNQFKEDIVLKIHDDITGSQPEIGFSIKSMIGGAATLLNASGATNFRYEIKGLDLGKVAEINAINTGSKIRDRLEVIGSLGGELVFAGTESEVFNSNLRLCDTIMPEILASMLLAYNMGREKTLEGLIDYLVSVGAKIHGFQLDRVGYEHKIQNLLYAVALGMVPNTRWDGQMRAPGGYIIVREDGELVGYNVYNADIFRKYLLRNTKLETASSTRHEFGMIYEEEGKLFIKLNLQIRFVK